MWLRSLRLCFFLKRRQRGNCPLIKASASSTGAVGYISFDFLRTSRTWSKYPLTSISECDESDERSVSLSIITELVSSEQQVANDDWPVPDFTTVCTSSRFFCSAPGSSSSIVEIESKTPTSSSSSVLLPHPVLKVVRDSVAVETYSACPYLDFKRSMLEMVEASRSMKETTAARLSFLHEMLICYLALNHKSTHKLIIHAFADLLLNHVVEEASDNNGGN